MLKVTRSAVARWLEALLHIHDSPRRIAAAYALGVFLGFSPFWGLHSVVGVMLAFALNLNRVAVLLGVWSNLPWIVVPYYGFATAVGAMILGTRLPADLTAKLGAAVELSPFSAEFRRVIDLLHPLVWPFVIGSMIGATVLAALAYQVALAFLQARAHHRTHASPHSHA